MNELASHSIWAITVGAILFAQLGLVECGDISLNHHVGLAMGEGALKKEVNNEYFVRSFGNIINSK